MHAFSAVTAPIAILGYGRFGRALGSLLTLAGRGFRAYDPHVELPPQLAASTLEELVEGAELVVLSVPVPVTKSVLEQLLPHLSAGQIVIDVGSVKTTPTIAMEEVLGDRVPWVGTHPLFGPTSLALGERPIHVVVCPNDRHPEAVATVRDFWASIDCRVIEQDAESHDRGMAQTHALTYFVAKGMLDAKAGEGVTFAPPSFQAIARTIDTVRSDAGHLFGAIHRQNPFAAEARRALIDALTNVDAMLAQDEAPTPTVRAALAIPDLGQDAPELREARELIDEVDEELVNLLGRRAVLSKRAGQAKSGIGAPVRDPGRERELLDRRRGWGEERGLGGKDIDEIFDAILRFSRRVQGSE